MTAKKKKSLSFFQLLFLDAKAQTLLMMLPSLVFQYFVKTFFVSSSLTETLMYQINLFMFANRFFLQNGFG
jgi:hypothetical protein